MQHLSYSLAKQVMAGAAAKGRRVPTGHLPPGRKGNKQAGSPWAGFGAKVTTLPPKCVQSTDLLGKDNLGRKVLNNKVTDLAQKKTDLDFSSRQVRSLPCDQKHRETFQTQSPHGVRGGVSQPIQGAGAPLRVTKSLEWRGPNAEPARPSKATDDHTPRVARFISTTQQPSTETLPPSSLRGNQGAHLGLYDTKLHLKIDLKYDELCQIPP